MTLSELIVFTNMAITATNAFVDLGRAWLRHVLAVRRVSTRPAQTV